MDELNPSVPREHGSSEITAVNNYQIAKYNDDGKPLPPSSVGHESENSDFTSVSDLTMEHCLTKPHPVAQSMLEIPEEDTSRERDLIEPVESFYSTSRVPSSAIESSVVVSSTGTGEYSVLSLPMSQTSSPSNYTPPSPERDNESPSLPEKEQRKDFFNRRLYIILFFLIAIIAIGAAVVVLFLVGVIDLNPGAPTTQTTGSSNTPDVTPMPSMATTSTEPVQGPSSAPNQSPFGTLLPTITISASPSGFMGTMSPTVTASPTSDPIVVALFQLLVRVSFDGGVNLGRDGTPQNLAFRWLSAVPNLTDFTEYELITRYALATFYYSTGGDNWTDNSGWLIERDYCNWFPIQVGDNLICTDDGRILAVALQRNNLQGTLPVELAHLTTLVAIVLSENSLTGTVPVQYYQELNLNLFVMRLFQNSLTGIVPTEIGLLTRLAELDLDSNRFNGTIPTEFGNLPAMDTLWLNNNQLVGTIPTELAQITNLKNLYLGNNMLTGTVPEGLCVLELSNLQADCNIECSCCTGRDSCVPTSVPSSAPSISQESLLDKLVQLSPDGGVALRTGGTPQNRSFQWLLEDDQLALPDHRILQRYALSTLYYSTSGESWTQQFDFLSSGAECSWYPGRDGLPVCFVGDFIFNVFLPNNNLGGTLPDELGLMGQLLILDFYQNQIGGTIPTTLGLISTLEIYVDFEANQFTGTIPSELGLLSDLRVLWLNDNNLAGTVPTELGTMSSLEGLYLEDNPMLSGSIPRELCELKNLTALSVDCDNVFCDCCVPACSVSAPNTTILDELKAFLAPFTLDGGASWSDFASPQYRALKWLSDNSMLSQQSNTTKIQRYTLATLYYSTSGQSWNSTTNWLTDVDECMWYTSANSGVCSASGDITIIDLSENRLDGTIPAELALLSNSLFVLELSRNRGLSGSVPTEIGLMTNLEVASLGMLLLTGTLPTEVGNLPSLSFFSVFNNLMDSYIPSEFGLCQSLVTLDFGINEFNGTIPTEIGNISQLQGFSIYNTLISGTIPTEMGGLVNLEELFVDASLLVAPVHDEVCNLTLLEFWSDCDEVNCTCCTRCCSGPSDSACTEVVRR